MSLLERLQNALNKIYAGNTITGNIDEGVSHKDQYKCPCCNEIVEEHEFIHELKVCRQCWEDKHGSGYVSIDQAEYRKGDI